MLDFLNNLLTNSEIPFITTIIIGIIATTHPCILVTNITIIGYLCKDITNQRTVLKNGLFYTLGRTTSYTLIAIILIAILRFGTNASGIEQFFTEEGEHFLSPILIIFGLFILLEHKIKIRGKHVNEEQGKTLKKKGYWGAFLLGALLAMAFCPTVAILYFGMLIPLSVEAAGGYLLPVVFALVSAIPVLIIAWLIAFSFQKIGKFYENIQKFEKWFRIIAGVLFLAVGIFEGVAHFFE